jgi:hypothetical protein
MLFCRFLLKLKNLTDCNNPLGRGAAGPPAAPRDFARNFVNEFSAKSARSSASSN